MNQTTRRRFTWKHKLLIAIILFVVGVDAALFLLLQIWNTDGGTDFTRAVLARVQGQPTATVLQPKDRDELFPNYQLPAALATATPIATATPVATLVPTATPVPTPTPYLVRTYGQKDEKGDTYEVQQWSDGRYVSKLVATRIPITGPIGTIAAYENSKKIGIGDDVYYYVKTTYYPETPSTVWEVVGGLPANAISYWWGRNVSGSVKGYNSIFISTGCDDKPGTYYVSIEASDPVGTSRGVVTLIVENRKSSRCR